MKRTNGTKKTTTNGACEVVVLLDRSGSMSSIKKEMEGGFDQFVKEQRAVPGICVLTLVQFDSQGIDTVHEAKPIADVPALDLAPRGLTPLLDAVGQTITKTKARWDAKKFSKLLFLVITDGQENASREFKKDQIKKLVEDQ